MKFVHRVRGKDGVDRLYLRKAGLPRIALKGAWETPELEAEVEALVAGQQVAAPATLRASIRDYELNSADFRALADSTKYEYRLILKELEDDFGDLPVGYFTSERILTLRNGWSVRGHRAANNRIQVLKNVLWPAVVAGRHFAGDPFALIPAVRRPRDAEEPHLLWPEEVVAKFIAAALKAGKPGLARAVAIGRYAGPRREDITRLTRAARKRGRFAYLAGKKRVPVDMPEDPRLTAVLEATDGGPMILAYNLSGLAYTADGLGQEIRKIIRALAATAPTHPGHIDSDRYDIHGLRHTFGVEAALAGATDAQGAALLGHASPNSFATYRRQANRIRLADDAAKQIAALTARAAEAGLGREVENVLENFRKTGPAQPAKPRGKNAARSST